MSKRNLFNEQRKQASIEHQQYERGEEFLHLTVLIPNEKHKQLI